MKDGDSTIMVSIICLVYNHEPFLRQCLDGFIMQKTSFPFEAIVHDDVSTDGSVDIIKEYAEKYPNIIKPIFEKENLYSKHDGSLFKTVYFAGKGKYTALCEGDDYWTDPYKLQKQVAIMENDNSLALCFHKCDTTSGANRYPVTPENNRLSAKDIIRHHYIPTASLLYKTSLMDNVNDLRLTIGDMPLEIQLAMQGDAFFINEIMSVYRDDNEKSITHDSKSSRKGKYDYVIMYSKLLWKYKFHKYSLWLLLELCHRILQVPLIIRNIYFR